MELVWKALSDKTRRKILDLLREKERTTGELCKHFRKLTRYGVMKHLNILHNANLIIIKREGKNRWNYINPLPIQEIYERWVKKYEAGWSSYLINFKNNMEKNEMEKIKFQVAVRIDKPIAEVFRAFTDKETISKYFVSAASAPIKAVGDKITWSWGEHKAEIVITEFEENKRIAFTWPGYKVNYDVHALFIFEEVDGKTRVSVTEEGWKDDEAGINSSLMNNAGWKEMLLGMKAWVMYGVDLRK
ncbi:MAG TPA: SRPBCC domain-containing protein [Ignavibacteria bacterium]|nr:SRPBCC domain-containing protein [Ignavibacteria bacterium]HMQ99309.1 SRPBCC domain-containing protein [Ignavibacteria bacterium]